MSDDDSAKINSCFDDLDSKDAVIIAQAKEIQSIKNLNQESQFLKDAKWFAICFFAAWAATKVK